MQRLKLLGLSGSLRKISYNTAALKALQLLAPDQVNITLGDIGSLPLFNPDREDESIQAVAALKQDVKAANGLIIASPEYAHGISAPMKNALDWLVGGDEFPSVPVMLINTSPRASHAQDALKEVIITMSGNIIERACIAIPLLGSDLDAGGIVTNRQIANSLQCAIRMFCEEIRTLSV